MFNLVYKSVVVECSTGVEDLAKAIEAQEYEKAAQIRDNIRELEKKEGE